jgi:DNA-binding transcriptional LysR family regulator
MDTLTQMRVFVRIAESGTFTAAADTLNTSPGAVSRAIADLETRLRTRLFNRSTRRVGLTSAGQVYLGRCRQILADVDLAEEEAGDAHQRPVGKLRIHSFTGFGQHYVLPAVKEYRATHPDVKVELTLSQEEPELFESGVDVGIVATSSVLPDSDLVSHLLGTSFSVVCASPEYLAAHGTPRSAAELTDHECIVLHTPAFPANEWLLESERGALSMSVSGALELNTAESVAAAIQAGMGIGVVPVYVALERLFNGSLVRVLPDCISQKMNIYAIHPSRKYVDAKTRTWIQFLREYLPVVTARDVRQLEAHAATGMASASH